MAIDLSKRLGNTFDAGATDRYDEN